MFLWFHVLKSQKLKKNTFVATNNENAKTTFDAKVVANRKEDEKFIRDENAQI